MIEFLDAALASFAMVTSFFHVDFAIVAFFEFLVGFGKWAILESGIGGIAERESQVVDDNDDEEEIA